MEKITPQIWLGGLLDAQDTETLQANGITATLNVAKELEGRISNGLYQVHVSLVDEVSNLPHYYRQAIQSLDQLVKDGHNTLVHCYAGCSRSPTIVAGYLMMTLSLDISQAFNLILAKKPDVIPGGEHVEIMLDVVKEISR